MMGDLIRSVRPMHWLTSLMAIGVGCVAGCQHERATVVEHRVVEERPVPVEVPPPPPNPPGDPLAVGNAPPPVDVRQGPPAIIPDAAPPPADVPAPVQPAPAPAVVTQGVQPATPAPAVADAPQAIAQATASVDINYQPPPQEVYGAYEQDLSPYGSWVDTQQYGRCWLPRDCRQGWRPYLDGYWQYSQYGWLWTPTGNEAQWGMITYHYGRWFPDRTHGWVWAPGTVWAPAWVGWREGHGYCAWAPLPPAVGDGVALNAAVVDRYCPADWFVGSELRYLGTPQLTQNLILNNTTIINQTNNITNITYENGRAINRGVQVAAVAKASGRRIEPVKLAEATTVDQARKLHEQHQPVLFAPPQVAKIGQERIENHGRGAENANGNAASHNRTPQSPAAKNGATETGTARAPAAERTPAAERPTAADRSTPRNGNGNDAEKGNQAQPAAGHVPGGSEPGHTPGTPRGENREKTPAQTGTFAPPAVNAPPPRATEPPAGEAREHGQSPRNDGNSVNNNNGVNNGNRESNGGAGEAQPTPAPSRGPSTPSTPSTPPADHIAPTPPANSNAAPPRGPVNNNAGHAPAGNGPAENGPAGHAPTGGAAPQGNAAPAATNGGKP